LNILNKTLQKQIFAHAEKEYPKECCGLIVKATSKKIYIPCINTADTEHQEDEFVISPEAYAEAEDQGEILAVVHSHCDHTTQPSVRDSAVCSQMEIPWIIVSYPEKDLRVITPQYYPLEGRPFCHGTRLDCVGLIKDYYKENLNIHINHYEHSRWWWEQGEDLYGQLHEQEGFFKVTDGTLKEHDVIVMKIRADIENHGGIYVGNSMMLHHMFGKLSKKEIYGGYWAEKTSYILRHKSVGD